MQLLKLFSPGQRSESASQGDLLAKVRRLVDCLHQAGELAGRGKVYAHSEIAEFAIAAAHESEREMARLLERISELEQLAITDELTGLLNRRGFQGELKRALSSASRYGEQGVLIYIYIDLDDFKPINDTFGHAAGDEVLRRVAGLLRDNVRDADYVGRMGGDEFAILLTRTTWEDGLSRTEEMDRLLNTSCSSWQGRMIKIGASLGLQAYGSMDNGQELLGRADAAMYQTKRLRTDVTARQAIA